MKQRLLVAALACLVYSGISGSARAGVVVSFVGLPDSPIIAPPSGTLDLTIGVAIAADTVAGTQELLGYSIPIDILPPSDLGLPTGLDVTAVDGVFDFGGLGFSTGDVADVFGQDGNFVAASSFSTNPTTLFEFTLAIGPDIAPGRYTFAFVEGGTFSFTRPGDGMNPPTNLDPSEVDPLSGQLVIAVPEPGTWAGVVALGTVQLIRRRR